MDIDKKMKEENKIMGDSESHGPVFKMSNGMIRIKRINARQRGKTPTDYKILAARANTFGKLSFGGAIVIFNAFFWVYSIFQYIDGKFRCNVIYIYT